MIRIRHLLLATALSALALGAHAAETKKELVQRLLELQQPAVDGIARNLASQPANQLMAEAARVLPQVPEAKRQQAARNIEAEVKKYLDETTPLIRDRAVKLLPTTLGAALEQKMTEDELKQVIAWLESPAYRKYQEVLPEVQQSLLQKLVDETKPTVEPKIRQLQAAMRKHLGLPDSPPAAGSGASADKPKK
ncbi:DUF2059 domain-containing protein [Caldimonas aquatica]|uniref:DUF2059 domain-containing protein n=1 Tax=Caldimonas aquatica TaxID=376175 RepID=A0ABY6MPR2_9BURK|nr:DUF2059 domain-containing protein [Schlegelella aquatica]UZD54144.1 DUF2059 domain-containing protein [Schlegelella aquatica]